MILNVLLLTGGLVFLIATGVFLFQLSRAPVGLEDESGYRVVERREPVRSGKFESADVTGFSPSAPNTPVS